MRIRRWVLCIAFIAFPLVGAAWGQAVPEDFNRLCLHNGGEYYVNLMQGGYLAGSGKYYPKYTHIPATGHDQGGGNYIYPWKVIGWSGTCMKGPNGTSNFYFLSTLQAIYDNPYNFTAVPSVHCSCTFPAPVGYYNNIVSTSGPPSPVWTLGGGLPSSIPYVGGKYLLFPSSSTWNSSANIFAAGGMTFSVFPVNPYYSYSFAFLASAGTITLPSSASIWQWVWEGLPPWGNNDFHYLVFSGDEMDHNAGYPYNSATDLPGYKGKGHLLIMRGSLNNVSWNPVNGGDSHSCDMCLFLEDACLTPVNVSAHAAGNANNPFNTLGFDVATTCQTPLVTGGGNGLQIMIEDYNSSGVDYILLAARSGTGVPYDNGIHRVPHAYDNITDYFLQRPTFWYCACSYPYPVCSWGLNNGIGGHSPFVSFGAYFNSWLPGKEFWFSAFPVVNGDDCTAGFMTTWF